MDTDRVVANAGDEQWRTLLWQIERIADVLAPVRSPRPRLGLSTAAAIAILVLWFALAWFAAFSLAFHLPAVTQAAITGTVVLWNKAATQIGALNLRMLLPPAEPGLGIHASVGALGGTIVVATLQRVVEAFREISGDLPKLHIGRMIKSWLAVFAAIFGLALATFAVEEAEKAFGGTPAGPDRASLPSISTLTIESHDVSRPIFTIDIPFMSNAARRTIEGGNDAVSVNPVFREYLAAVGRRLQDCVQRDRQSGPPVSIAITGFASPNTWDMALRDVRHIESSLNSKGDAGGAKPYTQARKQMEVIRASGLAATEGEAFNHWAGDQRASAVLNMLFPESSGAPPQGVVVDNMMQRYRQSVIASILPIVDASADGERSPVQTFTRMARLEILALGRCDRRLIAGSAAPPSMEPQVAAAIRKGGDQTIDR